MHWRFSDRRASPRFGLQRRVLESALNTLAANTLTLIVVLVPILAPLCIERQGADRTAGRTLQKNWSLQALRGALVDVSGRPVRLVGVSWAGFETQSFAPHGLNVRNYQDMLNQMAHLGFNTIRLPYSNQLFDPT